MDKSKINFKEVRVEVDTPVLAEESSKLIGALSADTPEIIIKKLLGTLDLWLPKYDAVRKQAEEVHAGGLSSLFPHVIYGLRHEKPIAIFQGKDVFEYKIIKHYVLWLRVQDLLLKRINDQVILKLLKPTDFNSVLARPELGQYTAFIQKAIEHHLAKDYVSSIHVLVPQIEGVLRECLRLAGLDVLCEGKNGGWQEKTISKLLDQTSGINQVIDTDFIEYIRYFLVREIGDNKRNELAHALLQESEFREVLSLRLILLLLLFYRSFQAKS